MARREQASFAEVFCGGAAGPTWRRADVIDSAGMDSPLSRITIDPELCGGRPCIRGLRIRVTDVLELLAAGQTPEQILGEYPYLEPEDISASLLYAARRLDHPTAAA